MLYCSTISTPTIESYKNSMKKLLYTFIIGPLIVASSLNRTMDRKTTIEGVNTVAFISNDTLVVGSIAGAYLCKHTNQGPITPLNKTPTYNIITDLPQKKIGLLCKNFFLVYNTETKQKTKSYLIPNGNSYSAAFSSIDNTNFICQNEQLMGDSSVTPPFTGANNYFGVACHPTKKHILYPCSNTTLLEKALDNCSTTCYCPTIDTPVYPRHSDYIPDSIRSALYSPDGTHIAILTDKKNIFIYNPATKKTNPVVLNCSCINMAFIPHSSLIGLLCVCNSIHFVDCKIPKKIAQIDSLVPKGTSLTQNILINTLDFSPNGTQYAAVVNHKCFIDDIPPNAMSVVTKGKILSIYYLLKKYSYQNHYFLPLEVIQLFIQKLFDLKDKGADFIA